MPRLSLSLSLSLSVADKIIAEGYLEKDYDNLMTDFYVSFTEKRFEKLDFIENVIFVRKVQTLWELNKNNSPTEIRRFNFKPKLLNI